MHSHDNRGFHHAGRGTAAVREAIAKVWFGKHAVRNRLMMAGAGVLTVLAFAGSLRAPAGPPATATGTEGRSTRKPAVPWEAMRPHLSQAEQASAKAVESQLAAIEVFVSERKRGARAFAEAVLGWEGKFRAVGGVAEGVFVAVGELVGSKPGTGPDSFTRYVRNCFAQHVLAKEQLQSAINSVVAGYAAEIRGLERKLLVEVGADLDLSNAWPDVQAGRAIDGRSDLVIGQAIDVAAQDLLATIVKFTVSCVVGDAITDQITNKDDPFVKKQAINGAVSFGVDKALDGAFAGAGYDPEAALAAKVMASLDRLQLLLVEGDLITGTPGLRSRLMELHAERVRMRGEALHNYTLGKTPVVPAASSPILMKTSSLPSQGLLKSER